MDDSAPTVDRVVTNHETLKRLVRQHGGQPAVHVAGDSTRLALAFPGDDHEELSPITWDEFLARFEAAGLALAWSGETEAAELACALVDRDREDLDADAGGDDSAAHPKARDRDVPPEEDHEAEARAEVRYLAAMAEANADAHRDEPPFQS